MDHWSRIKGCKSSFRVHTNQTWDVQFVNYTFKIYDSKETWSDSCSRNECECNDAQERSGIRDRCRRQIRRKWIGQRHGRLCVWLTCQDRLERGWAVTSSTWSGRIWESRGWTCSTCRLDAPTQISKTTPSSHEKQSLLVSCSINNIQYSIPSRKTCTIPNNKPSKLF